MFEEKEKLLVTFTSVRVSMAGVVPMPANRKITTPMRVSCVQAIKAKVPEILPQDCTRQRMYVKNVVSDEKTITLVCKFAEKEAKAKIEAIKKAGFDVADHDPVFLMQAGPIHPNTTQALVDRRIREIFGDEKVIDSCTVHFDQTGIVARNLQLRIRSSKLKRVREAWKSITPEDAAAGYKLVWRHRVPPAQKVCRNCHEIGHLAGTCTNPLRCGWCHKAGHSHKVCTETHADCLLCRSPKHGTPQCPEGQYQSFELDDNGARKEKASPSRPASRSSSRSGVVSPAVSFASVASQQAKLERDVEAKVAAKVDEKLAILDSQVKALQSRVNTIDDAISRERKANDDRWDKLMQHMSSVEREFSKVGTKFGFVDRLFSSLIEKGVVTAHELQPAAPQAQPVPHPASAPSSPAPAVSNVDNTAAPLASVPVSAPASRPHTPTSSSARKRPSESEEQEQSTASDTKRQKDSKNRSPPGRPPAKAASGKPATAREVFASPAAHAGRA